MSIWRQLFAQVADALQARRLGHNLNAPLTLAGLLTRSVHQTNRLLALLFVQLFCCQPAASTTAPTTERSEEFACAEKWKAFKSLI